MNFLDGDSVMTRKAQQKRLFGLATLLGRRAQFYLDPTCCVGHGRHYYPLAPDFESTTLVMRNLYFGHFHVAGLYQIHRLNLVKYITRSKENFDLIIS